MKKIRYLIESLIVKLGMWFFYVLGEKKAANFAAKVARFIGKKISVNKLAYNNLSNAMPNLSKQEKEKILDDMWDNLGRVIGEYVHVAKCDVKDIGRYFTVSKETEQNLIDLKNSNKGGIFFSGHIGNWEIGPKAMIRYGLKSSTVYRPLNNPYVEEMTSKARGVELITKSASGNRKIIENIKKGEFVIILADQKISEGEPVKFFHDDAITTTSIARLALKYNIPLIPARCNRIGKESKFVIEVEKSLEFEKTDNLNNDILFLTSKINKKLEDWIRQYPSQWFWVHNRWKK